ncbi:ATP-binding cassette domain-containing protein [Kitasatospora sp. NPDC036755]|uniref:ABC transporter ATP-binding protein n=1 Tax=Kitasatospora sp. NPDC036755 TaxID=3154600 RepID=UPI0033E3CB4A
MSTTDPAVTAAGPAVSSDIDTDTVVTARGPAARAAGLSVALGVTPLLTDATLTLVPGRVTAVTGPSGAGKTTLLRALVGSLPPGAHVAAGSLTVLGRDILTLPPEELRRLRRHGLAFVGQDPGSGLNPRMRVDRLIAETSPRRGRTPVPDLLRAVRLPVGEGLEHRRTASLSGGQQRRVALARALARRPAILLLDEPTAGLDAALRDDIAGLLRDLADHEDIAIALTSHDSEFVARCADEVLALRPARPVPTPRRPTTSSAATTVGAFAGTEPVVEVTALGARVGTGRARRQVFAGLDLALRPGTLTGITGPSGCGKSTLLRTLAGLHGPEAGRIALGGEALAPTYRGRTRDQRRRIQLVPQNPLGALNPAHTVGATLARPLRLHFARPADRCGARVAELLTAVGLTPEHAERRPHELSGGQRQRVSIARALAAEPDVLLCDEVTSALDAETAEGIMELLRGLRADRGLAVVLVSHDLPLVSAHADVLLTLGGADGAVPLAEQRAVPSPVPD